jgi:hypothetical protein
MATEEIAIDTEWGFRDGLKDWESAWQAVALCAVGLRTGRRWHFWGNDPRLHDFFRDYRDSVFVAHVAQSEMKYLLRLKIRLPPRWFCTYGAWRWLKNKPHPPGKPYWIGLVECLHKIHQPHLSPQIKEQLRDRIMRLAFDADDPATRREIINYCFSDCDGAAALYRYLEPRVRADWIAFFGDYLQAMSPIELNGIKIDLPTNDRLEAAAPGLLARLRDEVNQTWEVYKNGSFSREAFLAWARSENITWPTKRSKATGKWYPVLDGDTFREMEVRHPFIFRVREVLDTHRHLGKRTMVIDRVTAKHYYDCNPLGSVTGRNQAKGSIFGGPRWRRHLMIPESPDHILIYFDATAQEVGTLAGLSGDPNLRAIYEAEDCHEAFARRAGAIRPDADNDTRRLIRSQYKTVNLGLQYGQTSYGVSHRLGVTLEKAQALIDDYCRLFPVARAYTERYVQRAFDRGWVKTRCGWRSKVPPRSNERTWMNWPQQSTGGDIMRSVVVYLDKQGVRILAPVHDGFLLTCRRDQLDDLLAACGYAAKRAVEHSLPGFPMKWKPTIFKWRFEEERGAELWHRLQALLEEQHHAAAVR